MGSSVLRKCHIELFRRVSHLGKAKHTTEDFREGKIRAKLRRVKRRGGKDWGRGEATTERLR